MTIRIGIIGFGSHAKNKILPAIFSLSTYRLEIIHSRRDNLANDPSYPIQVKLTNNIDTFLASGIEVVYISTETGLHFQYAKICLEAGLSVWCEKPLATRKAEVLELASIARKKNLMLYEAFMFCFHNQMARIKELLLSPDIGELKAVETRFCFPHLKSENFRYSIAKGGGAYLDHACYLLKGLQMILGVKWQVISGCITSSPDFEIDIDGAAMLINENGLIANLNWGFGYAYVNSLRIITDKTIIEVSSPYTKPGSRSCQINVSESSGKPYQINVSQEDSFTAMFSQLAKDIKSPATVETHLEELLMFNTLFFDTRKLLLKL